MANKLENYDFGRPRAEDKYPYDKLFDGQIWQCFPNDDFKSEPNSFAQAMYGAARRRGIRCRCRVQGDGSVVLQAYQVKGGPPVPGDTKWESKVEAPAPGSSAA